MQMAKVPTSLQPAHTYAYSVSQRSTKNLRTHTRLLWRDIDACRSLVNLLWRDASIDDRIDDRIDVYIDVPDDPIDVTDVCINLARISALVCPQCSH